MNDIFRREGTSTETT